MTRLHRRSLLAGATAIVASPAIVQAQNVGEWPKGQLKIIVPFPPGGSTDPVARIIQAKVMEQTGWNIVIWNEYDAKFCRYRHSRDLRMSDRPIGSPATGSALSPPPGLLS